MELPYSLTDYLSKGVGCPKKMLDCINGKCENGCHPLDVDDLGRWGEIMVAYNVFEKVDTSYFDSNGIQKVYKRTTGVDKKKSDLVQECSNGLFATSVRIANDNFY